MNRIFTGLRSLSFALMVAAVLVSGAGTALRAQQPADQIRLSIPNGDLHLVLLEYEKHTGKKIIRDNAVEGGKVTIETSGTVTKAEAIQFIEQSLLLNGYAIVPSGPNLVKVVAFEAGKQPRNEGVRVFSDPAAIPDSDEVITYILPLSFLQPEDAVAALQQIAPGHPYGSITPLANAQALIITENSVTIRAYLDLMSHIDVQPGTTEQKTFALERADAEDVVEALKELLGLDDAESPGTGVRPVTQPSRPQPTNPTPNPGGGALPPPAPAAAAQAGASVGGTDRSGSSPAPRLFAVLRTNRVLVIATPFDMARIELLVQELDSPADSRRFLSIPLRYVSVLGVLDALRSSLLSGAKSDETGSETGSAGGATSGLGGALRPQGQLGGLNSGGGSSMFGSSLSGGGGSGFGSGSSFGGGSGFGGSGFGSGSGSGFGSSSFGSGGSGANQAPVSVIVGKTLIIADSVSNELFISGPPDHLETLAELVAQLDRKPRQVIISAVIGQLTLGNDLESGVDYFRTLDGQIAGSLRTRSGLSSGAAPKIGDMADFAKLAGATTGGFTLYGLIGNRLSTYLSLLENTSRFKVLSNPTVFTLNNVPAAISTGQRIAVPSNTLTTAGLPGQNASVSATVQYEEVVLEIQVIPLINSENEVTLQIQQKNDDVGDRTNIGGNLVPNITTQQLTTTVVVPNRSSVLLGGLITERDRETSNGLPILSRIPIARHAFSGNKVEKDRSELLIFLQPTIVENPQLAPEVGDEVSEDSALAAGIPTFPHQADPQGRTFAVGGGKVPMWKKVFGKKSTVKGVPAATVEPAPPKPTAPGR